MTIVIGISTTIPFTLAVLFSTTSLEDVSLSYLPIVSVYISMSKTEIEAADTSQMEVYYQALSSRAGAAVLSFWIL